MKGKFMGRVTLGALASGSLGAVMYLINSSKKNKANRSGHGFDGYDVDGYDVDEEVPDDSRSANTTPDSNYYMDAPIKDTPNRIQPGDVSSTVVNTRDYDADLIICDLDDMVYSSLTVEIPPNKYMSISCYEVYDDYENLEDYFE
tara:strand:+ start:36 stop:470 length:435 start_codon:yes stop_codon:yes gene_type:complete